MIALGTHQPMEEPAVERLLGLPLAERVRRYPTVRVFNHRWDRADALATIGVISAAEAAELTGGLLEREVPVRLNRMVEDYDAVLLCGPVFPHEVAGYSGGAKYLFPGIAGAEIIDFTHWLGALCTSLATIGVAHTPVRRVIHRAAEFLRPEVLCAALVLDGEALHGLWVGGHREAFEAAAELSAQLNVIRVPRPFQRVLSMPAERYDDLWTAAKAMYKTEPVVADRPGRLPRPRLLPGAVGPVQGRAGRDPGPQHPREGVGHVRRRHGRGAAAHPGHAGHRDPRGALPAHRPGLPGPPRDRPGGVGGPRGRGPAGRAACGREAVSAGVNSPSPSAGNTVELGRAEARLKQDEVRVERDDGWRP